MMLMRDGVAGVGMPDPAAFCRFALIPAICENVHL